MAGVRLTDLVGFRRHKHRTVIGHAATIVAGEWITASGEWVNDRTHGQQFKARFLKASAPSRLTASRSISAPA
jgi:hypothetical protein